MEPVGLDLAINVSDIFSYVNEFFTSVWPLLAVGLAILVAPKVIRMIKSSAS